MTHPLMSLGNTPRITLLAVVLLSCPRAHADVTLEEVQRIDLGRALTIESLTTTAISGAKARIESRQTIRSPMSSRPEDGSVTTVRIVRGDRDKEYAYFEGTSRYTEQDLQGKQYDHPEGAAGRLLPGCSTPKVTVGFRAATAIAGLSTHEATVRATQECKDPESARMCTAVLTVHRWLAAEVPFAKETAELPARMRLEFGGLYPSPDASDVLIERARASLRIMLNAPLDVQLWRALESNVKTLQGVVVKSTLELAVQPCYPLYGGAPEGTAEGVPQFATMMLGMLTSAVLMEWLNRNEGSRQPAVLFLQSSELRAIQRGAIDPSQFEVPAQLMRETPAKR